MPPNLKVLPCAAALFVLVFWICFSSCEKEVHIDLTNGTPQLVVNGSIETGNPPVILLTKSFGYLGNISLSTIANTFVHDARVTVNNGLREVALREYAIDTGGTYKFYFYSLDSADQQSLSFLGKTNETYKLSITTGGKTYESVTGIPDCKPLDSLAALPPERIDLKKPTALVLNVYYSDPDTPGNNIRYFTSVNGAPFYTASTSVLDDALANGRKGVRLPLFIGRDRSELSNDSSGYLFPDDRVIVKWCAIDRAVFNFYTTFEYSIGSVGNPFSAPINVRTNITNGALGIWAGYGVTRSTLSVPK